MPRVMPREKSRKRPLRKERPLCCDGGMRSADSHVADRGLVDVPVHDAGGLGARVDHLAVAGVDAHVVAEVDDVAGLGLSSGDEGAR